MVATAVLLALDPLTGLDNGLDPANLIAATIATSALALCYSSVAFAVGAATGNRSMALGIGSAVAVVGFAVESLAAQVPVLRPVRDITPWHWRLHGDPLRRGWALDIWGPPFLVSVA